MKVLLSLILFSAFTVRAQEVCDRAGLVASLKLAGLVCEQVVKGSCTYDQCEGKVPGYSKPVLFLVPQSAKSLRLHFHGHILGAYPAYEKNLKSMVRAFGIAPSICAGDEIVAFPQSSGNCADYDRELAGAGIKTFLAGVHTATGNHLKSLPLHLSGHSGGGRTIGRFLKGGVTVDEVTIFDGIYNEWVRTELAKWYTDSKQLKLVAVKPNTPYNQSKLLQAKFAPSAKPQALTLKGKSYTRLSNGNFSFQYRGTGTLKDHYDVLSESW